MLANARLRGVSEDARDDGTESSGIRYGGVAAASVAVMEVAAVAVAVTMGSHGW